MNGEKLQKSPLYHFQQRGYLEHWNGERLVTVSGWFWLSLDGKTVIRRKIGGRNCYQYAMVEGATFYADSNAKR